MNENQWTAITYFGYPVKAIDGGYIKAGDRCFYRWNVARQRDEWSRERLGE